MSFLAVLALLVGCKESDINQPLPSNEVLNVSLPDYVPVMPIPATNPLTKDGVALGKQLFFDPALSVTGTVSCGTCHDIQKAFADGMALSTLGVTGNQLPRHTQTLQNLAWHPLLFWDGGVRNLESLSAAPIQEHDEMGYNMISVVNQLNRSGRYQQQVKQAFKQDSLTQSTLLRALAQYMRTLVSFDSKYDNWRQGRTTLSAEELDGLTVVRQKCTPCHAEPFFTDHDFHNTGLQLTYNDPYKEYIRTGRYRITLQEQDRGRFKTPTLRNIMVSAPYTHDGRLADIDAVLDHYDQRVVNSPQLDTVLKRDSVRPGIRLSAPEKEAIKAFLHTLTDQNFLNQRR